MSRMAVRRFARQNVVALLDVNLSTDGDLWTATEALSPADLDEFAAEVRRIIARIERTAASTDVPA